MHGQAARTEHAPGTLEAQAAELALRHAALDGAGLLRPLIEREFHRRIAVVSSFGTESAVLLALAAEVDPAIPVIFLDTGKLFGETLRYRDQLVERLGLRDVRTLQPDAGALARLDPDSMLWQRDADACCHVRKVEPLDHALSGFTAWISGRKRYQGATRTAIPLIEAAGDHIKINPLASWTRERLEEEFKRRDLPRHPLEADGFLSIGCYTCSSRVEAGADPRAGRWAGTAKVECGIHRPSRRSNIGSDQ